MDSGSMYLVFGMGFALAMGLVWLTSPLAGRLARRFKVLDVPDHRKQHAKVVPRMGGVAVFTGIMVSFPLLLLCSATARELILPHLRQLLYLGAGGLLLFIVGLVDDVRGIRPRTKLIFQVGAALLAFHGGFQFLLFRGDVGGGTLAGIAVSLALTVLWTIGTTNAVNLIDGLDGLASGITGIALVTLGFISIGNSHFTTALAAFICAGAAAGFLCHNRHPAKIFLGDSGSLLLGFLLAALTIDGTQQGSLVASLIGPLCLLYVPLLDTSLAMIRRALKGLPVTYPDNHHIHHRLLRRGIEHPRVVFILWGVAFAVGELALVIHFMQHPYKALVVNAFAVALLILTLRHLANLEIAESLRTVRNINRRKLTPRGKVLMLRRDLELASRHATADSLLEALQKAADRLGLDSLKVTMAPPSRPDEVVTVLSWDRNVSAGKGPQDWKAARNALAAACETAAYAIQPGILLTVELGRCAWKDRRRSEDVQLWARILVEKLATLEPLRIFCPGKAETLYSVSEFR